MSYTVTYTELTKDGQYLRTKEFSQLQDAVNETVACSSGFAICSDQDGKVIGFHPGLYKMAVQTLATIMQTDV